MCKFIQVDCEELVLNILEIKEALVFLLEFIVAFVFLHETSLVVIRAFMRWIDDKFLHYI